eukprot:m51a1_g4069 hypothetical protein (257) ;mRNA; r:754354-755210
MASTRDAVHECVDEFSKHSHRLLTMLSTIVERGPGTTASLGGGDAATTAIVDQLTSRTNELGTLLKRVDEHQALDLKFDALFQQKAAFDEALGKFYATVSSAVGPVRSAYEAASKSLEAHQAAVDCSLDPEEVVSYAFKVSGTCSDCGGASLRPFPSDDEMRALSAEMDIAQPDYDMVGAQGDVVEVIGMVDEGIPVVGEVPPSVPLQPPPPSSSGGIAASEPVLAVAAPAGMGEDDFNEDDDDFNLDEEDDDTHQ